MFDAPAPAVVDRMLAAQRHAADRFGLRATGHRVWGYQGRTLSSAAGPHWLRVVCAEACTGGGKLWDGPSTSRTLPESVPRPGLFRIRDWTTDGIKDPHHPRLRRGNEEHHRPGAEQSAHAEGDRLRSRRLLDVLLQTLLRRPRITHHLQRGSSNLHDSTDADESRENPERHPPILKHRKPTDGNHQPPERGLPHPQLDPIPHNTPQPQNQQPPRVPNPIIKHPEPTMIHRRRVPTPRVLRRDMPGRRSQRRGADIQGVERGAGPALRAEGLRFASDWFGLRPNGPLRGLR
ncbi:hypothetical protein [Streptomyces sp. NPDC057939]|uniref:hypothetical protein n=1 Tax=Streptomyces sp. NPDC057939 TaxID=3346284 RepID=UPI0036E5D49F